MRDFRRYLRQVAAWQAAAWVCRFFAFYFFLEAFNIGGSVRNALLVMSVQALSTLTPFTPGGAGAQQALLVYVFRDIAPKTAVLAYSVGQQIAMAHYGTWGNSTTPGGFEIGTWPPGSMTAGGAIRSWLIGLPRI